MRRVEGALTNVGPPTRQQPVAVMEVVVILPLLHAERPVTVSARRSHRRSPEPPAVALTRARLR